MHMYIDTKTYDAYIKHTYGCLSMCTYDETVADRKIRQKCEKTDARVHNVLHTTTVVLQERVATEQ